MTEKILQERVTAERNAWKALAGYKFWMFGYWAAAWIKYNQLLPRELRGPNPFKALVELARAKG